MERYALQNKNRVCLALTSLLLFRDASCLSQWDASLERSLASLEFGDAEEIRAATGPQQIRDFMAALLLVKDTQPIKHAAAMLLPSLGHFEIFDAFFVTSLRPCPETSAVWGMLYVVVKVCVPLLFLRLRFAICMYPYRFSKMLRCRAARRRVAQGPQTNRRDDQEARTED